MRTTGLLVGMLLLPWGSPVAGRADRPGPAASPDARLRAFNQLGRGIYQNARQEALARGGPVVLFDGDTLVLRYGLERTSATVSPPLYHHLKVFAHVPLIIHALLVHHTGKELTDERLFDLRRYRARVEAIVPLVRQVGFSAEQERRQSQILRASLSFLGTIGKEGKVEEKALVAYARRMKPLLEANIAEAARAQIDGLHRQMQVWRKQLSGRDWERLTVIVQGTQMPRKDNLASQYFARLLGVSGEGPRIVYAEALFDEARALNLLGTHRVDGRVAVDFFGDPRRMHRDLLGDAARAYLDEVFRK